MRSFFSAIDGFLDNDIGAEVERHEFRRLSTRPFGKHHGCRRIELKNDAPLCVFFIHSLRYMGYNSSNHRWPTAHTLEPKHQVHCFPHNEFRSLTRLPPPPRTAAVLAAASSAASGAGPCFFFFVSFIAGAVQYDLHGQRSPRSRQLPPEAHRVPSRTPPVPSTPSPPPTRSEGCRNIPNSRNGRNRGMLCYAMVERDYSRCIILMLHRLKHCSFSTKN